MPVSEIPRGASDVAIIGGGVMGAACAYFLALRGAAVTVIEADPSYARASSALSAGSIRQQFSTPVCMRMSAFGFDFLKAAEARLGVEGENAHIGLLERGYLYLADAAAEPGLAAAIRLQQAQGAPVDALTPAELAVRFAWLNTDDLRLGALGRAGEGWFDGHGLLQAFRRKARALGAVFIRAKATGLILTGGAVAGARTTAGDLAAPVVVNAAGHAAARVAAWAGVSLPVAPERRCVFVIDAPDGPADLPLLIDPSGLWIRPEGGYFIVGGPATPHPHAPAPCFDVDHAQFEQALWPALAARIPAFETLRLIRAWAGQYEMNLFDHNALLGWAPGAPGLMLVTGFSGHGLQHAPAAGRGVAELILDGGFTTLDLADLDPARVAGGRPLRELNII
jgi:glycine/D-amino acid oxidase-like deaminating enzyme